MKYIGKIDDIIFSGRFIVRTTFKPKLGATVVDQHKKELGKIKQVIGPVKNPYLIISPNKGIKASFDIIGNNVYLL
jgi:rRNA processing protein Gar1